MACVNWQLTFFGLDGSDICGFFGTEPYYLDGEPSNLGTAVFLGAECNTFDSAKEGYYSYSYNANIRYFYAEQNPSTGKVEIVLTGECGGCYSAVIENRGGLSYFDCCGNWVEYKEGTIADGSIITLDPSKPYTGVIVVQGPTSTPVCPTPTPTITPTPTPLPTRTPTPTPSFTPTQTLTPSPSITPSKSFVPQPRNECVSDVIFPMQISGRVVLLPSTPTSADGSVEVVIVGGTAPYSITWQNGERTAIITGLRNGLYPVQVVDFYGDYTANTVVELSKTANCNLQGNVILATPTQTPSVTPQPTPTQTQTKTPQPTPTQTQTPSSTPYEIFTVQSRSLTGARFNQVISSSSGFLVDWGDGSTDTYAAGTSTPTHNYASPYTGNINILSRNLSTITRFSTITGGIGTGTTSLSGMTVLGTELVELDGIQDFWLGENFLFSGGTNQLPSTLTNLQIYDGFMSGSTSQLPSNMTRFSTFDGFNNTMSGNTVNIPRSMTIFDVYGSNTITGQISDLPSGLTTVRIFGNNTISGNTMDIPSGVTVFQIIGQSYVYGDLGMIPSGITNLYIFGNNYISGSTCSLSARTALDGGTLVISNNDGSTTGNTITGPLSCLPKKINTLHIGGNNTISGNTLDFPTGSTTSVSLYLNMGGSNTITGDVNDIPKYTTSLFLTGQNTISGNTSGLPTNVTAMILGGNNTLSGRLDDIPNNLFYIDIQGNSNITEYTGKTWVNNMNLLRILPSNSATKFTDTSIDELLIDLTGYTWSFSSRFGTNPKIELRGTGTTASQAAKDKLSGSTGSGGLGVELILYP